MTPTAVPDDDPDDETPIVHWYRLDAQDRLVGLDPQWERFARANGGGTALDMGRVLGRPLWQFVSGDATRMLLDACLSAARLTGRPRTLPYRCDAPGRRRDLRMTLTPLPDGGMLVEHVLLASHRHPARVPLQTRPAPAAGSTRWLRCSQCLCLSATGPAGPWLDAQAMSALAAGPAVWVEDSVCPLCRARALATTSG